MTGHSSIETGVLFGLDPLWLSTIILVFTYAFILTEKVHRTVIALLGAGLMVITGTLTQEQAFSGIDFNTIALLTGMMIIVAITRKTGVFEFVAIWSAKKVKAEPPERAHCFGGSDRGFFCIPGQFNNGVAYNACCFTDCG